MNVASRKLVTDKETLTSQIAEFSKNLQVLYYILHIKMACRVQAVGSFSL